MDREQQVRLSDGRMNARPHSASIGALVFPRDAIVGYLRPQIHRVDGLEQIPLPHRVRERRLLLVQVRPLQGTPGPGVQAVPVVLTLAPGKPGVTRGPLGTPGQLSAAQEFKDIGVQVFLARPMRV